MKERLCRLSGVCSLVAEIVFVHLKTYRWDDNILSDYESVRYIPLERKTTLM